MVLLVVLAFIRVIVVSVLLLLVLVLSLLVLVVARASCVVIGGVGHADGHLLLHGLAIVSMFQLVLLLLLVLLGLALERTVVAIVVCMILV